MKMESEKYLTEFSLKELKYLNIYLHRKRIIFIKKYTAIRMLIWRKKCILFLYFFIK